MKVVPVLLLVAVCSPVGRPASNVQWTLVRSSHFEVYSQAGESEGRSVALWLEQLRAFFAITAALHADQNLERHGPVRVIEFRSAKEYAAFQLQSTADAYFVGGEAADYIVMPRLGPEELAVTAHEYAHLVLHSQGLRLPQWFAEGMADLFSTVRIADDGSSIGRDLPMRTQALRQRPWIPLPQLLERRENAPARMDRKEAETFYAESWALTDMLVFSPAYATQFTHLWNVMASGASDADAVARLYDRPLTAIMADLNAWVQKPKSGIPLPGVPAFSRQLRVSSLTSFELHKTLADLLLACVDLERAEAAYSQLARERPDDPALAAALGTIALRKNDKAKAREQWKRAIQLGLRDAMLCYRYAILAEDAGAEQDDVIDSLRRAIELRPDFDDARYKLGLLESNSGNYEAALGQFSAMRPVPAARAYAYWTAVASALTETDRREQAKDAAHKAMSYAASAEERASALQLAYVADTDLTVQLARDSKGNLRMVTARKPHGVDNWNPFIEPGDHIRGLTGRIRKVECSAGKITGFRIESTSETVEVALVDPTHVMIGGGTAEFVCGAEDGRRVAIQYAQFEKYPSADGVLRGMQFQ